jgi:RecA/RadA recombinase
MGSRNDGRSYGRSFDETAAEFSRFSGMSKIRSGKWSEIAMGAIKTSPQKIRTSSLNAQVHWCAGLTLSKGVWTQNDLEWEIESADVAKTLHMLMENIGIRCIFYPCLDTFSHDKYKVALRDLLAQRAAQELIWKGYSPPRDWKGNFVVEQDETHVCIRKTLSRARGLLIEEGDENAANSVDVEDVDKDNLEKVADLLFPMSRRKKTFDRVYETLLLLSAPTTYLDRVTFSRETGVEVPMADLSVPIGARYSTGGLVSHNSTMAMHLCAREMEHRSDSVCVFQDFEHSMASRYARKMGLHKFGKRFLLIPSDLFEEADAYVKLFHKQKVWPAIWVIDSVPAMVPKAMWELEEGKNPQVALQARLLSDLLARWVKIADDYGITFLLLNQLRAKISTGFTDKGRTSPGIPGSEKENPAGGFALRFYSSLTIDLRPSKIIKAGVFNPFLGKEEDIPVANMVKMTVRKNKCGSPYRSAMGYIQFGEGLDTIRTLFDLALTQGIIRLEKTTYKVSLPDNQVLSVVGQERFIEALKGKTHGSLGPLAVDHLQKALQWDRADEVHSQVLRLTEEDVESGEETPGESADELGIVSQGMIDSVMSHSLLTERAEALNMLTHRGKTVYWTNPESQAEFSGRRLELLEQKLGDEDYAVLEGLVNGKIWEMKEALRKQLADEVVEEIENLKDIPEQDQGSFPTDGDTPEDTGEETRETTSPEAEALLAEVDAMPELPDQPDDIDLIFNANGNSGNGE